MYLTQLALLSLLVASQTTSMSRRHDDVQGQLDMEQFDCVSTGEKWRAYKSEAFKILAGKCDDSGSSLADHLLGIDMGGPNVGAPAFSHRQISAMASRCGAYSGRGRSCSSTGGYAILRRRLSPTCSQQWAALHSRMDGRQSPSLTRCLISLRDDQSCAK